MKMLFPLALVLVILTSSYGSHSHKGMNSIERAKHIREVNTNQNHGKQLHQIRGSIVDKESLSERSLSGRSRSGRSLRESFYNQIVARSCGASACCSKKGGICMTNDQPCPGEVTGDCMGDYCVCCIPKCECPDQCQSSRCCTRKGGTCISNDKKCNGTQRPRLCLGASCTCCIPPTSTTTTSTTTTSTTTTSATTTSTTTTSTTTTSTTTTSTTTTVGVDCTYDGLGYKDGDDIYAGCAHLRCENNTIVPRDGVNEDCVSCQVFNDPHFNPFEGTDFRFSWHQRCNFSLVQNAQDDNPEYAVYGEFSDCLEGYRRGPACVSKTVIVDSQHNILRFSHRDLKNMIVNGVSQQTPSDGSIYMHGDTLVWKKIRQYTRVLTADGLYVELLPSKINIWAPPGLEESLYGLCRFKGGSSTGYNGKKQMRSKIKKEKVETFALSWKTLVQESDCQSFDDPDLCAGVKFKVVKELVETCKATIEQVAPNLHADTKHNKTESCVQDLCVCSNQTACLEEINSMAKNDQSNQEHVFTAPPSGCGSSYFEVQDKLIQVCDQKATKAKAQEICRKGDSELISLEKIALFDELVGRPEIAVEWESMLWVDGHYNHNKSSYNWPSGAEIQKGWLPTKPTDKKQKCVLFTNYGKWIGLVDKNCNSENKFICAKVDDGAATNASAGCSLMKLDGLLVQICNKHSNWDDARKVCKGAGADLVSLTSPALFKEFANMPQLDLKWSAVIHACIKDNNYRILQTRTMEDCKEKCVKEIGILCTSIDYNPKNGKCHLSGLRSDSSSYTEPCYVDADEWLYAEREFDIDLKWSAVIHACIKRNNYRNFQTTTIEECKKECVKENGIRCKSIDYNPKIGECHLSVSGSDSSSYTEPCYVHADQWLYAEREFDIDLKWSAVIHACIRDNNYRNLKNTTMEDCKEKCVKEIGILCKSIDYNPKIGECHLSGLRSDSGYYTEPCYVDADGWLYAEREFDIGNHSFWVGGQYEQSESSYFWLTGEEIGRGWMPGKPSAKMFECVALGLWGKGKGGLTDLSCQKWAKFICMKDNVPINTTTSAHIKSTTSFPIETTTRTPYQNTTNEITSSTESSEQCAYPFFNVGGECFYISYASARWPVAQSYCRIWSAELVTPGSEELMNQLLNHKQLSYGTFWVGGSYDQRQSSYRWLTGETINSSYWQTGHPKQSSVRFCVAFESQGAHKRGLIEWQCHNAGRCICKKTRK